MTDDKDIDDLFDWGNLDIDIPEPDPNKTPIGSDIQRALRDECLKCSPYVKMESGASTRFDLAMYLPKPLEFITDPPTESHCWNKFRRKYCKLIWRKVMNDYAIPEDEIKERTDKLKEEYQGDRRWSRPSVPQYRYKGKEYQYSEDFWKSNAKKDIAVCDQVNCDWWKERQKDMKESRQEYGFLNGLHLFEIKSDKDDHSRLVHQIPNMLAIADYVWLVLGENQPIPEWLPPYISIMRYIDGEFEIEHHHGIQIQQPPMYWHSFHDQGFKIENKEEYALSRLMRDWRINSMFRFMFEGQVLIDMSEDIDKLMTFLNRAKKCKTQLEKEKFQRALFDKEFKIP